MNGNPHSYSLLSEILLQGQMSDQPGYTFNYLFDEQLDGPDPPTDSPDIVHAVQSMIHAQQTVSSLQRPPVMHEEQFQIVRSSCKIGTQYHVIL